MVPWFEVVSSHPNGRFPYSLMPIVPLVRLVLAGALSALITPVHAQIVELRATINAAQEVPANASRPAAPP
jgi:hypothetical protein